MKSVLAYTFVFFIFAYSSCTHTRTYGVPVQDPAEILKDKTSFMKYLHTLKLSEDFIALNTSSKIINKGKFLQEVSSGDSLPVRLTSIDSVYYKLYK
jgi:hypothetical protein